MRKFAILAATLVAMVSLAGCSHHSGSGGMGGGYFTSGK
jgi:hypothetical protein